MTQFFQVAPTPFLYGNNAQVSWASNTTLSIVAGQFRDSGNSNDIVATSTYITSPVTLNAAVVGLNGIDTGGLAVSTWYAVYMIGDSSGNKVPGFILGKLSTGYPILPFGYDMYKLIDYQLTDGSTHLLKNYNSGNYSDRVKYWDTIIASNVTAGTSTALANVTLAGVPPVDNIPAILQVAFTPATAADYVSFAVAASTATSLLSVSSVVAAKAQRVQIEMLSKLVSSAPTIQYINSAGSGSTAVSTIGFRYYV